ncbi:MAG: right-handed parallel beta-helix repeat-containing protein, partial [Saccharothrix sp.]|nr:right-handed parallel beta-helix repeat-containing protein [Saccharothrix sp.]
MTRAVKPWRRFFTSLAGAAVATAAAVAVAPPAAAAVTNFHVATTGSDTTGDGTAAHPWRTVQKARDSIRALLPAMTADIRVNLAPGDYSQTSTIEFTDADSGRNGHDVVYRSKGGTGSAHLVGGTQATGWSPYQNGVYRTNIGANKSVNTLYVDGDRATLARFPNRQYEADYPMSQAPYLLSSGVSGSNTQLSYNAGDLAGVDFSDPSAMSLGLWPGNQNYWSWYSERTPIASVDTTARVITLARSARYPLSNSRYFVQGALSLLDAPDEYFYDKASGYLYYKPESGTMADKSVTVPAVQKLVSVRGNSASAPAHNITFDGLTIRDTDFTADFRHGWVSAGDSGENHSNPRYDRQINLPQHRVGMVFLENTNHITVTNSHLTNAGYSAIYLLKTNRDNTFSNNWINRIGHSGVFLEGQYPGEGDTQYRNTVSNSVISQVGELVGSAAGVAFANSSRNTASHLDIFDTPRFATVIYADRDVDPDTDDYARNNLVEYVRVHDAAQDSGDVGAVYMFGISDTQPYATNTYNQITITGVRAHPSMKDLKPNGVFTDNDSFGQTFSNVEVYDTHGTAFRVNDSGSHVLNNVSWAAGFDPSAMQYANIGVNASFPYPGAADFTGGFTNGLANWSKGRGTPGTSTTVTHGGGSSFAQSGDTSVIYKDFVQAQRKRVTVWFHDDTNQTSLSAMARVDKDGWDGPEWRGLGVRTSISADKYVYRSGGTTTETPVTRTTGWHQFTFDYTSGTGVDLYIDGRLVASPTGVSEFDGIALGDWWADSVAGTAHWDDVSVASFAQDFEHGPGAFTATKGTAT